MQGSFEDWVSKKNLVEKKHRFSIQRIYQIITKLDLCSF